MTQTTAPLGLFARGEAGLAYTSARFSSPGGDGQVHGLGLVFGMVGGIVVAPSLALHVGLDLVSALDLADAPPEPARRASGWYEVAPKLGVTSLLMNLDAYVAGSVGVSLLTQVSPTRGGSRLFDSGLTTGLCADLTTGKFWRVSNGVAIGVSVSARVSNVSTESASLTNWTLGTLFHVLRTHHRIPGL